jgi:hypothetical protein
MFNALTERWENLRNETQIINSCCLSHIPDGYHGKTFNPVEQVFSKPGAMRRIGVMIFMMTVFLV